MLNEGLKIRQQEMRESSIEQVKWAVQYLYDLEGTHCRLTAVKLAEITGLSRTVLYKSHLRPIWDKTWVDSKEKQLQLIEKRATEQELSKLEALIKELEKRLKKQEIQNCNLIRDLETEKSRSKVYKKDYEDLKQRHEKLLYYNLRILQKLHMYGIQVDELEDFITE